MSSSYYAVDLANPFLLAQTPFLAFDSQCIMRHHSPSHSFANVGHVPYYAIIESLICGNINSCIG